MLPQLRPATESELSGLLAEATATATPVEVSGAGTKHDVGRPVQSASNVSTRIMRGITLYEPTELVMSARSGTPLSTIEAELAAHRQMLGFEPIDIAPAVGGEPRQGTIGGVFATNLSGARRISGAAVRDHLLGIRAVTGRGEAIKSGGRVMKNVTGYDVARALCGSWGTLAVLTEVTFKVMPMPEESGTLVFLGLSDDIAAEVLCQAMGTPYEVSGAVHIQAGLVARLWHAGLRSQGMAVTALRLENFPGFVAYRKEKFRAHFAAYGEAHDLGHESSLAFWDELRQLSLLQDSAGQLWRISTAPTSGPSVVAAITRYMDCKAFYDWSGGLIWAEVLPTSDAGAADIRRVIATCGGHATLIRAEPSVRAAVEVFQPMDPGHERLSRRLKQAFDPVGILNPGRMYPTM